MPLRGIGDTKCRDALIRVSEGDMSALTVLYDQLGRQIFSLAMSILGSYPDAEDVTQETFLKLAQHGSSFKKDGSARAWIMSIARNAAIDRLRRRSELLPDEEHAPEPSTGGDAVARVCEVNEMLQSLDELDRQIIILKVVDGFRFGEIAETLGISLANAQKRYQRAVKKLREEYK